METDHLMDRMGSVPILPIKWTITIGTRLNFDSDGDGHGDGDGTCKQTINVHLLRHSMQLYDGLFNYKVILDLVRGEYLQFEVMTRNVNIIVIHW